MNIIFLDIDGVLNSELHMMSTIGHNTAQTRYESQLEDIDEKAVSFLNNLIKDTNSKVVITSTWRINNSLEDLINIFKAKNFVGEIIGVTPRCSEDCVRGNEIYKWIKENESLLGVPYYKFNTYVIFDDDTDMLYWQKDNFFKTDPYVGLTPSNVYKATWFLNERGK